MRYSLLTLVVVTVWVALAMLVWVRWEPWVIGSERLTPTELKNRTADYAAMSRVGAEVSPDGTRFLSATDAMILRNHTSDDDAFVRSHGDAHLELYSLGNRSNDGTLHAGFGFLDNDRCLVAIAPSTGGHGDQIRYAIWYRRHPEWWWGHFYRPEVWALIALTVFSSVIAVRSRLKRHRGSA